MKLLILLILTPMLFAASSEESVAPSVKAAPDLVGNALREVESVLDGRKTVPEGASAIGDVLAQRGYRALGALFHDKFQIHIHPAPKPINRSFWCRPDMQMLYIGIGGVVVSIAGYYLIMRGMSE